MDRSQVLSHLLLRHGKSSTMRTGPSVFCWGSQEEIGLRTGMAKEADSCVVLDPAHPVSAGSRRLPRIAVQAPGRIPTAGPGPTPSTPSVLALPSRFFPPPTNHRNHFRPSSGSGPTATATSPYPTNFSTPHPRPSPPAPQEQGRWICRV